MASAIPSHLKSAAKSALGGSNGEAAEFARKHHGKTQSHMVSKEKVLVAPQEMHGEPPIGMSQRTER